MQRLARFAACSLVVLIVSSAVASQVQAGQYDDLWDLSGTDLVGSPTSSSRDPVEYREFGVVLSVTPLVNGRDGRSEAMFVLVDDAIFFNVGTEREPCWEPISEQEFRKLMAVVKDAGFDLTVETVDEEAAIILVLMI